MWKSILVSLVIIGTILFIGQLPATPQRLITPLSNEEEQSFLQKLVDSKIFEENKERVRAAPVDWAKGEGKPHPLMAAPAYLAVDKNGDVVYSANPDVRRSPASLTKLMTAMVVLDIVSPDEVFEVPKEAVGVEPTALLLEQGEKLLVRELLEAALITSANDAAETLARGAAKKLGGSKDVFIRLMNEKAKSMGLRDTRFKNPTGYDEDGQFSTARDLAKIAYWAAGNYPIIKEIIMTHSASISGTKDHKPYELPNWNALLGIYPGVDGVKIGNTEKAGHVTIVTSKRGQERFMVVLLGAPDRKARDLWAAELLDSAFVNVGVRPARVTWTMVKTRYRQWSEQLSRAQIITEEYKNEYQKE
ncbi:MAG: D-alanyl-D-alanine carboxypeptidase [Candidatus Blackburnbacteria bacterium]|nr:D-alanyl-D-alanine carboxypeptidase [Candidatus Blackburnbacteria bacterium]